MTPIDAWAQQIHQLTHAIERRWPHHHPTLDEIRSIATEVAALTPLAEDYTSPGDGLRSPAFTGGGRSIGSHADPVATDRTANATRGLDASANARRDTTDALRLALSTEDDRARRQHITDAKADATDALTPLHRLLPPANLVTRIRQSAEGDHGCASCRRIPGPDGKTPFFTRTEQGDRGPRNLCHWCRRISAARKADWLKAHPGQVPSDPRRFWPPTGALKVYRDHGRVTAGPAQWAAWDAADKKRKSA